MPTLAEKVRRRVWHSLSPDTAAVAGLSLGELQQLAAGHYQPSDEQLRALARALGIEEPVA